MFQKALEKNNLTKYFQRYDLRIIIPAGEEYFYDFFNDFLKSNEKLYIDPDCDPDGGFSLKIIMHMLDTLGCNRYTYTHHSTKRHKMPLSSARSIINAGYKYVLILDSSTNDIEVLEEFDKAGVRVLVIDHHELDSNVIYDTEKVHIINPQIDMFKRNISVLCDCSAGMITALLVENYVDLYHNSFLKLLKNYHLVYGLITLFSDSCRFSVYNIMLLRYIEMLADIPPIIELFFDAYNSTINRNFINYRFIPRINALYRLEEYRLLEMLLYDDGYKDSDFMNTIEFLYSKARSVRSDIGDFLINSGYVNKFQNSVYAVIPNNVVQDYSINKGINLRNFTGPIAQYLADWSGGVGYAFMETAPGLLEGSCRDTLNRDILSLTSPYFTAQGHPSAFGCSLPIDSLAYIQAYIDPKIEVKKECFVTVDWRGLNKYSEEVKLDVFQMAEFNEFSGDKIPEAIAIFTVTKDCRINNRERVSFCNFGDTLSIKYFNGSFSVGQTLILKPVKVSRGVECTVVVSKDRV